MHTEYPLFRSHLDLAHHYWTELVSTKDIVIDATCGNGNDTLKLAQLASEGKVYGFDVQRTAIENTKSLLGNRENIHLEVRCHSTFPSDLLPGTVKLIVYNLGYLPKGDKELTTLANTTLDSIKAAIELIMPGGAISITCYPGHPQGAVEQQVLLDYVKTLSPQTWNCCLHSWINRQSAPNLLLLQKNSAFPIRNSEK
jgi:SAM-dependent methyltransferase